MVLVIFLAQISGKCQPLCTFLAGNKGSLGNGRALDQDEISVSDSWRTTYGHILAEVAGGVSVSLPVEEFYAVVESQCFK